MREDEGVPGLNSTPWIMIGHRSQWGVQEALVAKVSDAEGLRLIV